MGTSKGMAPGVILPTVPGMGTSTPTKPPRATTGKSRVVKVPTTSLKVKGPRVKVVRPKMPKDAHRLGVPAHKRLREKPFQIPKRKPVI